MSKFVGTLMVLAFLSGCAQVQDVQRAIATGQPIQSKLSDLTLGEAKMQDDALEQSMIDALANADWKEEIKGLTITAPEWSVKRHAVSGEITHRVVPADVVAKLPSKSYCRLFSLSFKQAYDGADYGTTELNGVGDSVKVDCEKAVSTDNK